MIASEPESGAEDRGGPEEPASEAAGAEPISRRSSWPIVVAGIVAGLLAFGVGELSDWVIPSERVEFKVSGQSRITDSRQTPRVITKTAALEYAAMGLFLGAGLGMAGGLTRRPISAGRAAIAAGIGAILGAGVGAGLGFAIVPPTLAARAILSNPPIWFGMLEHLLASAPLGLAAGLAFAIGSGDRRMIVRAAMAGLGGAIAGSFASDILGAIAFPMGRTDDILAVGWPPRLAAPLLACVGAALAVAVTTSPKPHRPA